MTILADFLDFFHTAFPKAMQTQPSAYVHKTKWLNESLTCLLPDNRLFKPEEQPYA